jgi:hypothetical protein
MEYVEGLRGASKTKAAQLPLRSLLNRLTVCDPMGELAAIKGRVSGTPRGSHDDSGRRKLAADVNEGVGRFSTPSRNPSSYKAVIEANESGRSAFAKLEPFRSAVIVAVRGSHLKGALSTPHVPV